MATTKNILDSTGVVKKIHILSGTTVVADRSSSLPPNSCANNSNYLVNSGASGAWAGFDNFLATAMGTNAIDGWVFTDIRKAGRRIYVQNENVDLIWNLTSWAPYSPPTTAGSVSVSTISGLTSNNVQQALQEINSKIVIGGKNTIPVMAGAMISKANNSPEFNTLTTATNGVRYDVLNFDSANSEYVQFSIPMPKSWNEGNVTIQYLYTADANTGSVVWGAQAVSISDGDSLDAVFGSPIYTVDTTRGTGKLSQSVESDPITVGGTPTDNDFVTFQVFRDAANTSDTLSVDASLLSVKVFVTTDASDDS